MIALQELRTNIELIKKQLELLEEVEWHLDAEEAGRTHHQQMTEVRQLAK